jgi:7,8-dihydro-6-hydroxymethylpterin dimethyltransferase
MAAGAHTLNLVDAHVHAEANDTLDKLGIAKNAGEEKKRARDAKLKVLDPKQEAENARMMALYKEHVLGEKPAPGGFVPLGQIGLPNNGNDGAAKKEAAKEEVFGD